MNHSQWGLLWGPMLLLCLFSCSPSTPEPAPLQQKQNPKAYAELYEMKKNREGKIPWISPLKWEKQDAQLAAEFAEMYGVQPGVENIGGTTTQIGPFGTGGRTRALLIDISNPSRYFAGGVSGGLWRSTDAGGSWTAIDDFAASMAVSCIAQNPANTAEIYYGTGEGNGLGGGNPYLNGMGVMKSTDGGLSFSALSSTTTNSDFVTCNSIACSNNPNLTNRVFVGTSEGLMVSDDGGASWIKHIDNDFINDIISFSNGAVLVAGRSSVYYSPNGTLGSYTQNTLGMFSSRTRIANCVTQENNVYAVFTYNKVQAVYKSTNYGATWTLVNHPNTGTYGSYTLQIGVHPLDPNKLVVGGIKMYFSLDGGNTWAKSATSHDDYHAYAPQPNNPDKFLVGTDGGVYRFDWNTVANTTQKLNSGYLVTQFYHGSAMSSGLKAIGGTQDNGTVYMNAFGGTATRIDGGDGFRCYASRTEPIFGYTSRQNGNVSRKVDITNALTLSNCSYDDTQTGCFSTNVGNNPVFGTTGGMVGFRTNFEVNEANENQFYVIASDRIWRFDWTGVAPDGYTWTRISGFQPANSSRLACDNQLDPTVFVASSNRLYRKDNAGSSGESDAVVPLNADRPNELVGQSVGDIEVNPNNNSQLFLAFTSHGNYNHIYKVSNALTADQSTDPVVWNNISGNLPQDLPVNCLALNTEAPEYVIYAGTDFGLYYTLDGGLHWVKEATIPNVPIFDLDFRANDQTLFVFTFGRGAFAIQTPTLTTAQVSGTVRTEDGIAVQQVAVSVSNTTQTNGTAGDYLFDGLPIGANLEISPQKDIDDRNGVSGLDVVLISRHLQGIELLNSPYKMIAADVDNSGSINSFDLIEIQNLVLYITTEFSNVDSWRFVPSDFVFPDPSDPFASGFPEAISITGLSQNLTSQDFIGIKMGDLNATSDPANRLATGKNMLFRLKDKPLAAGEVVTLPVYADAFQNRIAYQYQMEWDASHVELVEVSANEQLPMEQARFHTEGNTISAVFCDPHSATSNGQSPRFSAPENG